MKAVHDLRTGLRAVVLVVTAAVLAVGAPIASAGETPSTAPDRASAAVLAAVRAQLGDTYVYGGNGPDGWDCSGLTSLWRTVGGAAGMPRTSGDQQAWAVPLPVEQAVAGDLVFFGSPVTHVGLLTGEGRLIDAAASRGTVVERSIWAADVVRYGRVPRPGMPQVSPWTPPAPAAPAPQQPEPPDDAQPPSAPRPAASSRSASRAPRAVPSPRPAATTAARRTALVPLAGLPVRQARPSSAVALRAAAAARAQRGAMTGDDVSLVRAAWRTADGRRLPASRSALVALGRTVALADARAGDLVVYNAPATHLGVYLGAGKMVDASATVGRVVVRDVYTTPSVRLVRLR